MLKHISIPTVPTTSPNGTSVSVYAQTSNSRPSRPTPVATHNRSQQPLNVSTLSTAPNGGPSLLQTFPNSHQSSLLTHSYPPDLHKSLQNGHVPRMFTPLPTFSSNSQQQLLKNCVGNNLNNISSSSLSSKSLHSKENNGTRETLTSLGLLCLGL